MNDDERRDLKLTALIFGSILWIGGIFVLFSIARRGPPLTLGTNNPQDKLALDLWFFQFLFWLLFSVFGVFYGIMAIFDSVVDRIRESTSAQYRELMLKGATMGGVLSFYNLPVFMFLVVTLYRTLLGWIQFVIIVGFIGAVTGIFTAHQAYRLSASNASVMPHFSLQTLCVAILLIAILCYVILLKRS